MDDVLVVGGGPAGRALAAACGARGLRTVLLDPAPDRPWRATYATWSDELPAGLPDRIVASRAPGRVVALGEHRLGWEYAVLDVPALRGHLDAELHRHGVGVRAGRAVGVPVPHTVTLADGRPARARIIVDAGGHRQPLQSGAGRDARRAAEQTAYGLVVPAERAAPLVASGTATFMDWRRDHGEPGWPTFLYGVPLGGGEVLLEETSLARRPGLPIPVLRRRLLARLARHGIVAAVRASDERVRFPVDRPRHRHPGVLAFGAAAPLVHPSTGFSVADALCLAPRVADALTRSPAAARAVVWSPAARAVHMLRRRGLEALLRMPPHEVPAFFEVFFGLGARHRWAYLTGRDDLAGMVAAMAALFGRSGWALRGRLVGPAFLSPAPALDPG
ncbi:lycopene cyclase family protein [Pseudonocardia asaccharolytica]|uniref:Putative carotenoid cyclase n=1 Tax=Pseudonocardia asaccharolytica DSM 44247 = NBRC 16224 TaxID=1123024 RepID=A0A511CWN9_9PSEU|nr:lycopene cyclase family protein [Pseudonocardia asaccharolytica]GEL16663.1 putative carotenoid cyclase [Pseudonocardia asaccharolytica DSM 44247 = NBRC 16224]